MCSSDLGRKRSEEHRQRRPQLTFATLQSVSGIGDVQGVLGTDKILPVVVQRVHTPVGVVGSVDDQLRLGQPVTVGIRIN